MTSREGGPVDDERALLAAILVQPDEDTPRLAYADWLDEHSRPERAEFIRLQCLPEPDEEQEERGYELEEAHRGRWLAALGVPQFAGARWEFRRGFPEFLQLDAGLVLGGYDAFARVPWLRRLSVVGVSNAEVRVLCGRPWPPQWAELDLYESLDTSDEPGYDSHPAVVALANCPQVEQLRRLRLVMFTFGAAGRRALVPLRDRLGARLVIE